MTQTPQKGPARPVTATDFERFTQGMELDLKCPACNHRKFSVGDPSEINHSHSWLSLDLTSPRIEGAGVAFVLLLVCDNCGFILPFLRQRVTDWMDQHDG